MSDTTAAAETGGQQDAAPDVVAALDATDPNVATSTTSEQDAAAPPPIVAVDIDDAVDGEEQLGDAGKRALERIKDNWRDERSARQAAEARIEQRAREAREEGLRSASDRIVAAEVRAAATGRMNNPELALRLVDLDQFEVAADGDVDRDAIAQAIADLLASEPGLAAQGGRAPIKADPSQGADGRGTASTADQFASAMTGLI